MLQENHADHYLLVQDRGPRSTSMKMWTSRRVSSALKLDIPAKGVNPNRKSSRRERESTGVLSQVIDMQTNTPLSAPSLRQFLHTPPVQTRGVLRICGGKTLRRQHVEELKIATWNVRSLLSPGKMENVIMEAKRNHIDILGMSEVRWPGADRITRNGYEMVYSGGEKYEHGVGILVSEKLSKMISTIIPASDRVMAIIIDSKPKPISIIQVYAPTTEHKDDEIEAFYDTIEKVLKKMRLDGPTYVIGDFNAKVGKGSTAGCIGAHGLGQRNERGDRMIEFADKNQMIVCNTFFQQHPRRLYTWKSPGDQFRNQIDYILINRRYKNAVLNCRTVPSADCNTDHILLKAECRIRLKKIPSKKDDENKIYTSPLKNKQKRKEFHQKLEQKTEQINPDDDVEEMWRAWKTAVIDTANDTLKRETKHEKRQPWMTEEIINMIDKRRQVRKRDSSEYKELNKKIASLCRKAKAAWYEARCQKMEKLHEDGNLREMHREIKWMMKQQKRKHSRLMIIEQNGEILCNKEEVEKAWVEYVKNLYKDGTRAVVAPEIEVGQLNTAPDITMTELEHAIRIARRNKAIGPDRIPVEIMKCLPPQSKKTLLRMINKMHRTGKIPEDFEISTFILIPKKKGTRETAQTSGQ